MKRSFASLPDLLAHPADTIIDVRAPSEFAEDHIPGAINLPVLDDAERAQVGTLYKQVSPFDARKLGAALVSRNAAKHIEGPLRDKPGDWQAMVYCWRGGQRSGSFATILSQIGWRITLIEGGYRAYRGLVRDALYDRPMPAPVVLLDGLTGTAKTDVLHLLTARGIQVLDLEGLAHHRGSILGARPEGQPTQKAFESALAAQILSLDPSRPVVVEAESKRIGALHLPPQLWAAMCTAPAITLNAPIAARAAYLAQTYADVIADGSGLRDSLDTLRGLRGGETHARWMTLLEAKDHSALAEALIRDHYDAAYRKASAVRPHKLLAEAHSDRLDPAGQAQLADQVTAALRAFK